MAADAYISIGDRDQYIVVEMSGNDLYSHCFTDKDEAIEYIEATDEKCMLICIEYGGCGSFDINIEPHT